jgi:hypothetical protein
MHGTTIKKMDHRYLGWEWLHEDREGYNWWAVANILIMPGFHKIRGIANSCGKYTLLKDEPTARPSHVFIRAIT